MNKALLAKRISAEAGISLEKARDALDCFLNAVCEEIEEGGEVNLHGFGCFFAEKRAESYAKFSKYRGKSESKRASM